MDAVEAERVICMRKVLLLILCVSLLTVLIACGPSGPDSSDSSAGRSSVSRAENSAETSALSEPEKPGGTSETSQTESEEQTTEEKEESGEEKPEEEPKEENPTEDPKQEDPEEPNNQEESKLEEIMAKKAKNSASIRFASIYDKANNTGETVYRMVVPYTDIYTLQCASAAKLEVLDKKGGILAEGAKSCVVSLNKNDTVYLRVVSPANAFFTVSVDKEYNHVELPYEVLETTKLSDYATTGNNAVDPLRPSAVSYTKRSDGRGLYINCNNPEKLTEVNLNTCLCVNDITNKDVFFTFEHNNLSVPFYYGYRVTNTGTEDLYVTVKNFGFQLDGPGTWLGEDEWIKFYNIAFRVDTSKYTASQKKNFDAYVGFGNTYASENRQPITYVIPAGQSFYVMGGTTRDAYANISVFGSADRTVKGGCSNGAVIFSTNGSSAKGEFVVYNDVSKLNENIKKRPQNGYVGDSKYGAQYVGSDDCHGVVDASFVWIFNDATKSGVLPVAYSNPFYTGKISGNPYEDITRRFTTRKFTNAAYWTTHINPNHTETAVGTDMTFYNTIDSVTGNNITIDYKHLDGRGSAANIGNWMVDYIETFTLVNQGDKDRVFTYKMTHTGVILAFVRDENGFVSSAYTPAYCVNIAKSEYGDAISQLFTYSITVPAHSVVRFSVDYNLCANSYGHIRHEANLK